MLFLSVENNRGKSELSLDINALDNFLSLVQKIQSKIFFFFFFFFFAWALTPLLNWITRPDVKLPQVLERKSRSSLIFHFIINNMAKDSFFDFHMFAFKDISFASLYIKLAPFHFEFKLNFPNLIMMTRKCNLNLLCILIYKDDKHWAVSYKKLCNKYCG